MTPQNSDGPTKPHDLAARLFAVATMRAAAKGRAFGEGASSDLRAMTLTAAVALLETEDDAEREELIRAAENDLTRLIDMAVDNAMAIVDYPSTLLGEQSYFPAKMRFCPCRPFC